MTALFPAMLAALASLAIPVVLHLIARQRFPVQDFPTIRLLEGERRSNTLAPRLVDVPQLLLRLAVLALIVLAMSRLFSPMLSGSPATRNVVVVLDASASMSQVVERPGGKGKATLFTLARERAESILADVRAPSRAALVIAGETTRVASPLQPGSDQAVAQLGEAKVFDASGAGLVEAVATACDMLRGRREVSSQVIVLTDLRRSALASAGQNDLRRIADAGKDLGSTLHVLVADLASGAGGNLSVAQAQVRGRQVMVGADAHVVSTIVNTGTKEQSTKVTLSVGDRKEPASKSVTVAPGARAVVDLTARVNRATRTFAQVGIDEDAYSRDDRFDVPLPVVDSRRILIVNGQSAAGKTGGETASGPMAAMAGGDAKAGAAADTHEPQIDGATILRFVLNPGRELGGSSNSGIDPVMVTAEAMTAQPLSKYEAVVLYDVSALPDQAMRDLATFVSEGKSLLIICSGRMSAVAFNRGLAAGGGDRPALSPAQLGNDIEPETPLEPALRDYSHPLLAPFADTRQGDLSVLRFTKIRALQTVADGAGVILQTSAGQPLAIERALGRGRVVLFTFGLELDRGNIARTRVFPPLMWRVVDYLTGQLKSLPPDQLQPRTPAVLDVSEPSFALASAVELVPARPAGPSTQPGSATQPAAPAGEALTLVASPERTVLIDALAPGRYLLQKASAPGEKNAIVTYARGVTVQEDPREGDMTRATEQDVRAALGQSTRIITGDLPADLVPAGGEFWKIFIFGLIFFYALEALAGFMTTVRRERERAPGAGGGAR